MQPYFYLQSSASPSQPHFIEELSQLHSFLFKELALHQNMLRYLRHSTVDTSITTDQVEASQLCLEVAVLTHKLCGLVVSLPFTHFLSCTSGTYLKVSLPFVVS